MLIAVTVLFCSMMLVPHVRAAVIETITEWYEKFVRFTTNAPESEKTNLEPGYLPEGFAEIFRNEMDKTTSIIYGNEDGTMITFQALRDQGSLSVDNEEMIYKISEIDGIEYHIFTSTEDNGENSIVWDMGSQRYKVSSVLSVNELVIIALSVEK